MKAELNKCPACGAPARLIWHGSLKFSIEAMPTVEVVRCKDCKHRGTSYDCPLRHLVFTEAEGYHYADSTTDDGYCNFGQPKEVEA